MDEHEMVAAYRSLGLEAEVRRYRNGTVTFRWVPGPNDPHEEICKDLNAGLLRMAGMLLEEVRGDG